MERGRFPGDQVSCRHTSPPGPLHTGDEYRPLFFYQETTAQILARALNPLDYMKWRRKSAYWKALKVFKVGGFLEPGSQPCESGKTVVTLPSPAL